MKLTVLGPGCWGLTLAWLLNDNFEDEFLKKQYPSKKFTNKMIKKSKNSKIKIYNSNGI